MLVRRKLENDCTRRPMVWPWLGHHASACHKSRSHRTREWFCFPSQSAAKAVSLPLAYASCQVPWALPLHSWFHGRKSEIQFFLRMYSDVSIVSQRTIERISLIIWCTVWTTRKTYRSRLGISDNAIENALITNSSISTAVSKPYMCHYSVIRSETNASPKIEWSQTRRELLFLAHTDTIFGSYQFKRRSIFRARPENIKGGNPFIKILPLICQHKQLSKTSTLQNAIHPLCDPPRSSHQWPNDIHNLFAF